MSTGAKQVRFLSDIVDLPAYQYILISALFVSCLIIASRFDTDFQTIYHVAALSHRQIDAVYTQKDSLGRFFYGPVSLVLTYPLGFLSYPQARLIWNLFQTLAFVFIWVFIYRFFPYLKKSVLFIPLWALAINPIHNNFQSGNIQLMLCAAILWVIPMLEQRNSSAFWGALILTLFGNIKVFPLYLVAYVFLACGSKARLGLIAGLALWGIIPALCFGPETSLTLYHGFFGNLVTYSSENSLANIYDILSLPSLFVRSFGLTTSASQGLSMILSAIALVFAVYQRKKGASPLLIWWFLLAVMALVNPSSRPHYFVFYIPAFCALVDERRKVSVLLGMIAVALIALTAEGIVGKSLNNMLEKWSLPTIGMLILVFSLVWRIPAASRKPALR